MRKRKLFFIAGFLLFSAVCGQLKAQVLKDTASLNLIFKEINYIYNLQFREADDIYNKIKSKYPEHPITFLFRGMKTYWENYPLIVTSSARNSYENDMRYAIDLCEKQKHPGDEAEYLLCDLGARGMLLQFYADNSLSMDVMPMAKGTYQLVRQSFRYTEKYADFYFFTGLYNYYREAYPEAHPVYKPFAIIFPAGNKLKGISDLQKASKNAIVLKAEAFSFLSGIFINFENNYQSGCQYSKSLLDLYPGNTLYLAEYIKNLLLIKKYSEAEELINFYQPKISNPYFQAQLTVFNGLLYEKNYQDIKVAEAYYSKGIRDLAPFGKYADDYTAYAYFGLSRISELRNDKRSKKVYRKQAMDLASFKKVNFDR